MTPEGTGKREEMKGVQGTIRKKAARAAQVVLFIGVLLPGILPAHSYAQDKGQELLAAAAKGDVRKVEKLLAARADVNTTDMDDKTPLILASLGGHTEAVRLLIGAGADVNAKDNLETTAIIWASLSPGRP